jgi:type II secretory pathway pseudopilin PulG
MFLLQCFPLLRLVRLKRSKCTRTISRLFLLPNPQFLVDYKLPRDALYNNMTSSTLHLFRILTHPQRQKNVQGFMLIEVIVAAVLTIILAGVAMQTIVAATVVRVRAQEAGEATSWIQSDFTQVKSNANGENMGYCPSGSTTSSCTGIIDNYRTDTAKCNATAPGSGYAQDLQTLLGAQTDIDKTSIIGSRPYIFRRTTSVKNQAPYTTLEVAYAVYRGTSVTGTPMNTFYTEVIPGVAFSCR